jgi:predicted amidohydrolase YtcJ
MNPVIPATLVLHNGKIFTVNQENSVHQSVVVHEDKIVYVGTDAEAQKYIGPETETIDLAGKLVLPGFIDSHVHLMGAGRLAVKAEKEADIKYCNSVTEVLDKIKEKARETPPGEWVIGWGYMWTRFKEKRVPTAKELDKVAPDNPVLLRFSAMGVANTLAMKKTGVTKDSKPDYGYIELDENGEPNGVLQGGAAVRLVSDHIPPWEIKPLEIAKKAIAQWVRWGITCAHQAGSLKEDTETLQLLRERGELPMRWRLYVHNMTNNLDYMDHLIALGIRNGLGDDFIRLSGVKFALDSMGSMGNAATYEPSTGNPDSLGILLVTPEKLTELIVKAHKAGLQTATHSIGDRAVDINLDAIEAAQKEIPREDHRHRIEHCTHCEPKQLERIKRLEVHPGESNYIWNFGDAYKYQFGEKRSRWLYPYKSFQEYGIIASANSDYGGGPWHGDPIRGIYAMVTRKTEGGDTIGENQRVSVMDAIRCYTYNGAYASFDEERLGSIEEGKLADMIVLSRDILEIPVEEIPQTEVLKTIVYGKIVYEKR